jgi:hypothetical protein
VADLPDLETIDLRLHRRVDDRGVVAYAVEVLTVSSTGRPYTDDELARGPSERRDQFLTDHAFLIDRRPCPVCGETLTAGDPVSTYSLDDRDGVYHLTVHERCAAQFLKDNAGAVPGWVGP